MALSDLSLRFALLVVIGGGLGALARYVVSGLFHTGAFPWGTAVVNLSGSIALAWLMYGGVFAGRVSPEARVFFGVAFLGAYTTMSTFAFETVSQVEHGRFAGALLNVVVNPVACLGGAWMGKVIGEWGV